MLKSIYQLNSQDYSSHTAINRLVNSDPSARQTNRQTFQRKFYDTFDWRLFNAGYLLEEDLSGNTRLL
ncbi:MAG TPA: hypothetical protein VJ981_09380, partial [Gammaproteobacteria bacterium]|nr:hypothetical protein [Gammaproteobacteria bacterium]